MIKNLFVLTFILLLLIIGSYILIDRSINKKKLLPLAGNDLRNAILTEGKFYTTVVLTKVNDNWNRIEGIFINPNATGSNRIPAQQQVEKLIVQNPPTWVNAEINKGKTDSVKNVFTNAKDKGHSVIAYPIITDLAGNFIPGLDQTTPLKINDADKSLFNQQLDEFKFAYKNFLKRNPGYRGVRYPNYIINAL